MLRHLFIGPAMPDCTDAQLSAVVKTLRGLTQLVPWIRKLSVEKSTAYAETRAVVLIAEFDSQQDFERYMSEPKHLALGAQIRDYIDLSRMTIVQTTTSHP